MGKLPFSNLIYDADYDISNAVYGSQNAQAANNATQSAPENLIKCGSGYRRNS